jgi:hypothetical protein
MKFFISIAILIFLSNLSYASDYNSEANLIWFHANYIEIVDIVEGSNNSLTLPVINTIGSIWVKRDGGTSGEISTLIAKALISRPDLMLSLFEVHAEEFEVWLEELESPLFTDFTGNDYEKLKTLHDELLNRMIEYSRDGDSRLIPFSLRLAEELKSIQVRIVD